MTQRSSFYAYLFLIICTFLTPVRSSTVIVIGGGPPPVDEGSYLSLYGFDEAFDYDTNDYSYTTEGYSNTQVSLTAYVEDLYPHWENDYEIRAYLENAPSGMSIDYNGSLTVKWTCPHVPSATNFSFIYGVELVVNEEVIERRNGDHTIFVRPATPIISSENLYFGGLRIQDPVEQTPSLSIWDPDESINGNELSIISSDPRFTITLNDEYSYQWDVKWNDTYEAPIVSEIIPIKLSLKDFDGTGLRRTQQTVNTSIFGYSYEDQRLPSPSPVEQGFFGTSVEISDNRAFVAEAGKAVYVYNKSSNGNWSLAHTIPAPDSNLDFGGSLAAFGPFLAVSAVSSDESIPGAVYIYRYYTFFNRWDLTQTLTPDESEHAGLFGGDIDLTQPTSNTTTLMVAADAGESNGEHTGAVWVFEDSTVSRVGSNFTKRQVIVPDDAEAYDYFGWPLALEGDIAALPANEDDDEWGNSGAVYVYRRNAQSGLWSQQQKLKASDGVYGDLFGERVCISEQGIFVSAFRKRSDLAPYNSTRVGAVYQFQEIDGVWEERPRIRTIEEEPYYSWISYYYSFPEENFEHTIERFGSSIEADGNTLLVAGRRTGQTWPAFGRSVVYQFEWDEVEQHWKEVRVLCGGDTNHWDAGDYGKAFGELQMLAIDGENIIVGDMNSESESVPDSGVAYLFNTDFTIPSTPSPKSTFESALSNLPAGKRRAEDDPDGDDILNLQEFFAGTDAMGPSAPIIWPVAQPSDFGDMAELHYYFRQAKQASGLVPEFYVSNSLEPDSWRKIETPLFGADTDAGDYLIRCIDISDEMSEDQPLFLKMSLNPADVGE